MILIPFFYIYEESRNIQKSLESFDDETSI